MTPEKIVQTILDKCDIYCGKALISKEAIIEQYLSFFANSLASQDSSVSFAFHTGSVCFDIVAMVSVALGCLSYNLSTNDDIISSLRPDEMVLYKGKRYRWKGTSVQYGNHYMALEQDGTGKKVKTTSYFPLEKNKHLIKAYYGDSRITDGRGVKKTGSYREDFLAFVLDADLVDIPTQIDVSVVVVADSTEFLSTLRQVRIVYDQGKAVGLLDIVSAAYYTGSGKEHQLGANPTKAEPVLKVTQKISKARDLVLNKHGNQVVGLLVMGGDSLRNSNSELEDLLRRKSLRIKCVTSSMKSGVGDRILDVYEDAPVFACTKEFLVQNANKVCFTNPFTQELYNQISNIVNNVVTPHLIPNGWSWDECRQLKSAILAVKQSNWPDSQKENFVITALGLVNLLNTAVFSMSEMEQIIAEGIINQTVISPKARIFELREAADCADTIQESCMMIAEVIERKYQEWFDRSPKADELKAYIDSHLGKKIAIVVPKAYYADILQHTHPEYFDSGNVICVTGNRLDVKKKYAAILCVGEINSRKFDPLQCTASRNVDVLLYGCEEKMFVYRQHTQGKYERKLNQKIGTLSKNHEIEEDQESAPIGEELETDVQRFSSLDEFIEEFGVFDIRKLAQGSTSASGSAMVSEVKWVGSFVSGERIFFSKYYSAVVFDNLSGTIEEKSPEQLQPGDVLVFVKRDDYTKNIVDYIYEKLLRAGHLERGAVDAYEKSQYWKEALREYKRSHDFSYREVTKKLHEVGGAMQEVTVRQWLIEDGHIVGPRNESTMEHIAVVTQDPHLLADAHGYFEACGVVRHDRRKILNLISKAINEKLSGNVPPEGSILSIVYENVDRLSKTLELENVSELDESVNMSLNLVNTPFLGTEV